MTDGLENSNDIGIAPGLDNIIDVHPLKGSITYLIGFLLSAALTIASFYLVRSHLLWAPSIPVALTVLAVAQIGVHLTFFLHLTTGHDNVNNSLALAFGTLVVTLVIGGTLWIMNSMNQHMPHMATALSQPHPNMQDLDNVDRLMEPRTIPQYSEITGTAVEILCHINMKVYKGQECAKIEILTPIQGSKSSSNDLKYLNEKIRDYSFRLAALEKKIRLTPSTNKNIKIKLNREANEIKQQLSEGRELAHHLHSPEINSNQIKSIFHLTSPVDGVVAASNIKIGDKLTPFSNIPLFIFNTRSNNH